MAEPIVHDGGDRLCAQLLLELCRLIVDLPDDTLHLVATDPAAPLDLPAWCHLTGHIYLGPTAGADRQTFALRLNQQARPTAPGKPWHPNAGAGTS
jgi:tRNA 2-thiouridine synthesizing protein A